MRICLINNLYHPWTRGGGESVVSLEARGLSSKGHDVFVISTAPEETKSDDVYFLRSIFYNIGSYPLWQRFFWHLSNLFPSKRIGKIVEIIKKEKPDLIITHNLVGVGLYLPRAIKRLGIRHFHVLHDIQLLHPSGLMYFGKEGIIDSLPARFYQWITKKLFISPEVVISPSSWLLSEHVRRGFFNNSKTKVIPNFFSSLSRDKNKAVSVTEDKFRFLFVGQLERHKGIELLLEAWEKLISDGLTKDSELVVVGPGSLSSALKEKYGDKASILGKKSLEEVYDIMRSSNLLIVPSLCYENSPTVIYEAASFGLPVLAADIGGIGELVKNFGGSLFAPGDVSGLAGQMKELLLNREKLNNMAKKESGFQVADHVAEIEALAKSGFKG